MPTVPPIKRMSKQTQDALLKRLEAVESRLAEIESAHAAIESRFAVWCGQLAKYEAHVSPNVDGNDDWTRQHMQDCRTVNDTLPLPY